MNQIQKLKARLATASPEEVKIFNALIRDLESEPEAAQDTKATTSKSVPDLRFFNNAEQAAMWIAIAEGRAKCIVREKVEREVD